MSFGSRRRCVPLAMLSVRRTEGERNCVVSYFERRRVSNAEGILSGPRRLSRRLIFAAYIVCSG